MCHFSRKQYNPLPSFCLCLLFRPFHSLWTIPQHLPLPWKRNNAKKRKNETLSVKRLLCLANPIMYTLKWPTVCGDGGEHSGPPLLLLLWFPNNYKLSVLWCISTLPGQYTLGMSWWMIRTLMVITVITATGVTEATDFRFLRRRRNSC